MKRLLVLLIPLLVCSWSHATLAQTTDSWVSVSLKGEERTVWMPKSYEVKAREFSFEQFKLDGRVYTATSEGVDFSVWSLVDKGDRENDLEASGAYLDACADLVWESLLKPRRDKLPKEAEGGMSYEGELKASDLSPGRDYFIMMDNRRGMTRFFVAGREIYVLIALNLDDKNIAAAQRFIYSFGPKKPAPPDTSLGFGRGGGLEPGRVGNMGGDDVEIDGRPSAAGGGIDYNRIFNGKEITQKVRILSKAEPQYTEPARRYSVEGTVILRAVFTGSGKVNNIKVVTSLPHGLTERAIAAAKGIKFIPAQKDGHAVSMYIQLEYNFNLY